jgi:CheY-like chemotaxis protein
MDLRPAVVEDMGYEAITSSDPEEALGLVVLGVLADVNMPGMNGCESLDRALRGDPGIHVIVMTGNTRWNRRCLPSGGARRIFC